MSDKPIIPSHQWTNGGSEVLILRCCDAGGKSYGKFQWPLIVGAAVESPDWDEKPECGGGLHGWPWGLSIGDGKEPDWRGIWIVFGSDPKDIVSLGEILERCRNDAGTMPELGKNIAGARPE